MTLASMCEYGVRAVAASCKANGSNRQIDPGVVRVVIYRAAPCIGSIFIPR